MPGLLDWIAFVLGMIGMAVALFQLFRSRNALVAAREALEEARETLIRDQTLQVLPSFSEISESLDDAMRQDSREFAELALQRFSFKASEALALLADSKRQYPDQVSALTKAKNAAGIARSRLFGSPDKSTTDLVGAAATQIRDIAVALREVAVIVSNEVGRPTK